MKKDFDCLEMKRTIQEKMFEETATLNDTERIEYFRQSKAQNPALSAYFNTVATANVPQHGYMFSTQ